MAKKVRELKDIELDEVSLVDKAANKKKFLFFKQDQDKEKQKMKKLKKKINIIIDSDGKISGTKISVNGDKLKNLRDFSFSFWSGNDSDARVSCSYSKFVETEDGFSRSETFYLSKGEIQMHEDIKKQLEEYFGDTDAIDFEKASEDAVVIKALETVNEYREDFPDDLKAAVGSIAKQAAMFVPKKAEKKTDTDDSDIDSLKKSLEKATKAITDLEATSEKKEPKSSENKETDTTDIVKTITALTKSISALEKKKEDATKEDLVEALTVLTKRLEVVEKGTGISKTILGQDDDNDNKDKKWPSFSK